MPIVKQVNSPNEQIIAVCGTLTLQIANLLTTKEQVTIAVSGGKSPIALFEYLSTLDLEWHKIIITLVDERIVPVTNEESNEYLVRTHLLKNKAVTATFIGLNVENNTLENINKNKLVIDIALLGMGEDGHTASIFATCKELPQALHDDIHQYIITTPTSAMFQRITLTLKALQEIPTIILIIAGASKLQVLNQALLGENPSLPISLLLKSRNDCQVIWSQ